MNRIATYPSSHRLPARTLGAQRTRLTLVERGLLLVGILEIPFGVDKYLAYQVEHGEMGAVAGYNFSVLLICLVALYAIWMIAVAKRELAAFKPLFGFPMLIYLGTVAVSVVMAENKHLALSELFLLTQAYALFFYLANRIRDYEDFVFIVGCFAIALVLQGLVMIGLRAAGSTMFGRRVDFGPVPLSVSADGRTEGTMLSPVVAGSLMALMFLVSLPLFLTVKQRAFRWALGLCLSIGLVGMLFTQTRGAILTVLIGSVVIGLGMFSRGWLPRWTIGTALAGFLIAAIPLAGVLQKRIFEGDEGSAESRVHLTSIAFNTIAQHPVVGYGAGNCHLACLNQANSPPYRSEWYFTIHCKYLVVWIETGLIGLLAFLAMFANGFRYGIIAWLKGCPRLSPLALGCTAAVLGYSIHMFVDIYNSRPQVQLLWVLFGLMASLYQQSSVKAFGKMAGG